MSDTCASAAANYYFHCCIWFVCLQISGVDSKGYRFQRITPTAISAIRPQVPNVTMVPLTRGYYDNPVTLTCSVDSLVPFELRWFKDNTPLGNTLYYRSHGEQLYYTALCVNSECFVTLCKNNTQLYCSRKFICLSCLIGRWHGRTINSVLL